VLAHSLVAKEDQSNHNPINYFSGNEQESMTRPLQVMEENDMDPISGTIETAFDARYSYSCGFTLQCGVVETKTLMALMTMYYNLKRQCEERELQLQRKLDEQEKQHKSELQQKDNIIAQQKTQILRQSATQAQNCFGLLTEKYLLKKHPHGIAVIINNYKFYPFSVNNEILPNRRGSQVDEENLCNTWRHLNYKVCTLTNLSAADITHQLMKIALQNHENYDSFVCCILSHGYLDGIYGSDSKPVAIADVANIFKGSYCPSLVGKPKLFFIQACRGKSTDAGIMENDGKNVFNDSLHHSLPSEADFLFGYATPPGKVSFRSPEHGSWYISCLCRVLQNNAHQLDLLSMLTIVNKEVCQAYSSEGDKQCPAPVSLLRKQVWFFDD